MLKNSDWIILNSITYKIHSIPDEKEMRLSIMKRLKNLIDFDSASFYLAAPFNEKELIGPVGIAYSLEDMNAYISQFKNMDYSEGLMFTGQNIAYRESDLAEDEIRKNTDYYKAVYNVQGWHYSLHLNICYREQFLGVMSFFRKKGQKDFQYEDIFVLDMIKEHLALRLYQEQEKKRHQKFSVRQCADQYHLSPKETLVLSHLIHDASAEEIAQQLGISISTLRKHCNHLYQKMGISQRIQLYEIVDATGAN